MATRILIADDSAFVRMMLNDLLVKSGYEVFQVSNGEDAVEQYAELKPDLVIMDVTMPGELKGLGALKKIRIMNPSAKVVAFGGSGERSGIDEMLRNGAAGALSKPIDRDAIAETLRELLGRG